MTLPSLELEFVYDPRRTSPEPSKTPVVVFRFEDVRLVEWHEDQGAMAAQMLTLMPRCGRSSSLTGTAPTRSH